MRVRFPAYALEVFDQFPAFRVYQQATLAAMAAHHGVDRVHPRLYRRILARDVDMNLILIRVLSEKLLHDVPIGLIRRAVPTVSRGIAIDVDDQRPITRPGLGLLQELLASLPGIRLQQNHFVQNADLPVYALADDRAHGVDVKIERPTDRMPRIIMLSLDVTLSVKAIVHSSLGEIFKAGLELLPP